MSSVIQALPPQPGTDALAIPRGSAVARDYAELVKARVTTLIVMAAWCGFYLGAAKSGASSLSWMLLHALLGIGLVSGGTAAMNEVVERDIDALMRRTALRPLVKHSMGVAQAAAIASAMILGGTLYLAIATNLLTAALTFLTSAVYLLAYTPLKKVSPLCTFVGAFPGAMPPVLGWTAIRGRLEWEAFVLFAILFFWQFPHFHSIALLYREDYERAGVRMLPVVEPSGVSTAQAIVVYGLGLIPVTVAPFLMGISGRLYFLGALALGLTLFWFCLRIWRARLAPSQLRAKTMARQLLQATVLYLPLLFALMMINSVSY
jgi:protoheme IX farnesyltransferase